MDEYKNCQPGVRRTSGMHQHVSSSNAEQQQLMLPHNTMSGCAVSKKWEKGVMTPPQLRSPPAPAPAPAQARCTQPSDSYSSARVVRAAPACFPSRAVGEGFVITGEVFWL